MTTPYTAVSVPQIYESAQGYKDLADDFRRVRSNLDNNIPDPTEAFGDDEYGRKAIPNIVQGKQEGDDLFDGIIDMVGGAGDNLEITAQSFDNSNKVNEGLANKSSFHPNP